MSGKYLGFAALLLMFLSSGCRIGTQGSPDDSPTVLPAAEAKVTGALKIQGKPEAATIHFWNKPDDTISWVWTVRKPGSYRVALNYSLARTMAGGSIRFVAGEQQIIAPAEPTRSWTDFRTFELGVVRIDRVGKVPVTLQAAQLPRVAGAALPDVAWLSLTPTNAPATSKTMSRATGSKATGAVTLSASSEESGHPASHAFASHTQ